jgi:hypothetical protein
MVGKVALLRSVSVNLAELGPLRPTPAHSQVSLRDGMYVRLRGGIRRALGWKGMRSRLWMGSAAVK